MHFRLLLLITTSYIHTLQSMEQSKPIIEADLMINENEAKSAAYGSKELHEVINAAGISTHPFDILIPVKTEPAVPGMPHYLPIKEIELCSTGTCLPFICNGKKTLLTCTDNPVSKLSFEQHCQKHITKFNESPCFAYSASYQNESTELRETLIQNKLIKPALSFQRRGVSVTILKHHVFKPYRIKRNNHKNITTRQLTSRKK